MLANEANLGFGDLMARMGVNEKSLRSKSQESCGAYQSGETGELEVKKKKSSDPNIAKSSATGSSAPKNYYHEFLKAQETFRRSSGLLVSEYTLGTKEIQTRRSSYSQGRQARSEGLNLVDETKINFRNRNKMKYRLIRSPLGLTSFRNHQIDEVAEDGVTEARDQDRTENEDQSKANSIRQNSADRQSYSLKLQRESKSRDRTGS